VTARDAVDPGWQKSASGAEKTLLDLMNTRYYQPDQTVTSAMSQATLAGIDGLAGKAAYSLMEAATTAALGVGASGLMGQMASGFDAMGGFGGIGNNLAQNNGWNYTDGGFYDTMQSSTPFVDPGFKGMYRLPDEEIFRGLGAMARNYEVVGPDGTVYKFMEGTRIHDSTVFAGHGTKYPLNEFVADGLASEFGGDPLKWKHAKGIGTINFFGEERLAEVHWFEEISVGKAKFKIKRWLD